MNKFTKEDLMDIAYRGSYDELERDLALQLLDGMEQDPVADVVAWSSPNEERTCDIRWRRHDVAPGPLYASPQPLTVEERAELQKYRKEVELLKEELALRIADAKLYRLAFENVDAELQEHRKAAGEPELKPANLINKFYERYPVASFKSDTERAAALGYFMAGAELQCFGEFVKYEELCGDE